jgi:hypothetical protein
MPKKVISDYLISGLQHMKINNPEAWRQYRIQTLTEKIENGYGLQKDKEELILLTEKGVNGEKRC